MNQTTLHWQDNGVEQQAFWHAENGAKPPKRVIIIDDTTPADTAYRWACEGTGLLWRGDFQNARALLQALARRIDKPHDDRPRVVRANKAKAALQTTSSAVATALERFNMHRLSQSQRARTLSMLLIELSPDYHIALRRAPDWREACTQVYGQPTSTTSTVVSLRELLGIVGAFEWRKNGIEIAALGTPPNNKIHPHYGVFSPVRGEYLDLVAACILPPSGRNNLTRIYDTSVFEIGTGTGVLAAILAKRGVQTIIATDNDPRALACAHENIHRLGYSKQITLVDADLFPPDTHYGKASLIVCNPPWLPARPSSPIERAVYDPDSHMLKHFLGAVKAHLLPNGEVWLILSDLAEHLGLRSRAELMSWIDAAGLTVLGRRDTKPRHSKTNQTQDALHWARAAEVTSLWRLGIQNNTH